MRVYKFDLPYILPAFTVGYAISKLKEERLYERLPEDLTFRMESACRNRIPVIIRKEDLDEIDIVTWGAIAHELHLDWDTE